MNTKDQKTSECECIRVMLDDYLDGELSPLDERVVKSHLFSCPTCAEEVKKLTTVFEELSLLGSPPNEVPQVIKRVQKVVRLDGKWYKKKRKKMISLVAASLALVLLWTVSTWPKPIQFEMNGDNVAFHSNGKNVYIDGSSLSGDLTVIGGDVYLEGHLDGNITSIDGRILAKVDDGNVFHRFLNSFTELWNRIWR